METDRVVLVLLRRPVAFAHPVQQEPDANVAAGKDRVARSRLGPLNLAWSAFFAVLGVVNLYVAFNYTTDAWVNFKLFGATGMMLAFVLLQSLWLSKYVDEDKKNNQ